MRPDWQNRVREKRLLAEKIPEPWMLPKDIRLSAKADNPISVLSIPTTCGILSPREILITEEYDVVGLLKELHAGRLSSYEVTLAFCKRAAISQQLVCLSTDADLKSKALRKPDRAASILTSTVLKVSCLTETFFQTALAKARKLDDYLHKHGRPVGALHGLPISVKDTFNIKGIHSTIGYVSFIGKTADHDSSLIRLLEEQGVVLYVKTNVPQTLFAPDSNNNIFGRTLNPHNLTLTAGGSSGGEGALVAMRGSICGIGSDMAGSIRIPAMCNGVFGFKPTEHRIPYDGQARPDRPGLPGPIYPVAGPIGRSARDMTFLMKTIIDAVPARYDFMSPPLPWRRLDVQSSRLVIGFIPECPSSKVARPIKETLETAKQQLQRAGHRIMEITSFPQFQEAHDISYCIFDMDNNETGLCHVTDSGEPMVPATKDLNPKYPGGRTHRKLDELWAANEARESIMRQWHAIFRDNQLDVLLLPGFRSTALPHDTMRSSPYMVMWNLVNYPAGIIPYGRVQEPRDNSAALKSENDIFKNAPCHLQLVAPTYLDEELTKAMEAVATDLGVGVLGSNNGTFRSYL